MASTNLNTMLKLSEVSEKLENSEYNPDNFPGIIWRPKNSYGVVVIMEDGRMMCTNIRSMEEVETIFKQLTKTLETEGVITPRSTCPNCNAVVDSEDVVCIDCGFLLQD
jgi:transcription initiation factor TFIID TATA-box-binding protein